MTALQVFEFGGRKVRTAGTHEAPLFCAADVCAVLGLDNVSEAIRRLKQTDLESIITADVQGKNRPIAYLTEAGLYKLVMKSRKPEAEAFVDWVTGEVLPAIRKHGYYSALEAHQAKQTERLLAEIFPSLPKKAQPIFRDLIAALLRMRGQANASGNPPWARSLANSVYEWAFRVPGQQAFRRSKNPKHNASSTDYSMLSTAGEAKLKSVVEAGCHFAKVSFSWRDWREKMDVVFGGKLLQAPMFPPLPEKK